jgi:hypothetical protein
MKLAIARRLSVGGGSLSAYLGGLTAINPQYSDCEGGLRLTAEC